MKFQPSLTDAYDTLTLERRPGKMILDFGSYIVSHCKPDNAVLIHGMT